MAWVGVLLLIFVGHPGWALILAIMILLVGN
jgi:hypothetical protein